MLSGFQEAAQAIQEKDENALVPFSLFYDTVNTFLESAIRRVIDRCQTAADNHDGIEQYDVSILKLLYLIRYVDMDVKGNLETITTLMVDDIRADKIVMRQKIQESLDRLTSQNYIARNAEIYTFLTDDEQDIEREIRNTPIDSAAIVQSIAGIIFGDLYVSKKFKYGSYDFPYDQIVDDTVIGQLTGAIRLRIVTVASDLYNSGEQTLKMKSNVDKEAILVLSDKYPYFDDLETAAKIRKYIKSRNVAQLPEAIQHIIRGKQQQASACEKNAKEHIVSAILDAAAFVYGEAVSVKMGSVKDKIEGVLSSLVDNVYTKLNLIKFNYSNDNELLQILDPQNKQRSLTTEMGLKNPDAVKEIEQFIDLQNMKMLPTSMGDIQRRFSGIPYGWREIDIAAAVVSLISIQRVTIQYSGNTIQPTDKHIPDYLRKKTDIDKTLVKKRVGIPQQIMNQSRVFLKDYFNVMDVPSDEDGLIAYVLQAFDGERHSLDTMLLHEYGYYAYPDKSVVENGIRLCESVLGQKKDNLALLNKMLSQRDDFFDFSEDMANVKGFFHSQRPVFDKAVALVRKLAGEEDYLQAEQEAMKALYRIKAIIGQTKPYKSISELPALMQTVESSYNQLLDLKKQEILNDIRGAMAEIHQTAREDQRDILAKADRALDEKRTAANAATTLTMLDAMKTHISNIRQQYLKALLVVVQPDVDTVSISRTAVCFTAKLESEKDIEQYTEKIREKLESMLKGHDVLHII